MQKAIYCVAIITTLITGCNSGSMDFMGVESQTVTVGQSTFNVRRLNGRVELVRTNPEFLTSLSQIIGRASVAVEETTGCTPRPGTWTGDQAMMQVEIDCPS